MGSFPEMRYEETEVWTKDATGNPVSSIGDLEHSKPAVHQMPQPRRTDHRTENGGRNRATPQGARTPSVYGNPVSRPVIENSAVLTAASPIAVAAKP